MPGQTTDDQRPGVMRRLGQITLGGLKETGSLYFSNIANLKSDADTIKTQIIQDGKSALDVFNRFKNAGGSPGKAIRNWFYSNDMMTFGFDDDMDDFDAGFKIDSASNGGEDEAAPVLDSNSMKDIAKKQSAENYKIAAKQADMSLANTAEIVSAINSRSAEVTAAVNKLGESLSTIAKKLDTLTGVTAEIAKSQQQQEASIIDSSGNISATAMFDSMWNGAKELGSSGKDWISFGLRQLTPQRLVSMGFDKLFSTNMGILGDKSVKDISENINNAIGDTIQSGLMKLLKSETFSSFFDVGSHRQGQDYSRFATNQYNTKPAVFDGMTRQTIVHIIPEYLKNIEAALTGGQPKSIDDKGRLTTKQENYFQNAVQGSIFRSSNAISNTSAVQSDVRMATGDPNISLEDIRLALDAVKMGFVIQMENYSAGHVSVNARGIVDPSELDLMNAGKTRLPEAIGYAISMLTSTMKGDRGYWETVIKTALISIGEKGRKTFAAEITTAAKDAQTTAMRHAAASSHPEQAGPMNIQFLMATGKNRIFDVKNRSKKEPTTGQAYVDKFANQQADTNGGPTPTPVPEITGGAIGGTATAENQTLIIGELEAIRDILLKGLNVFVVGTQQSNTQETRIAYNGNVSDQLATLGARVKHVNTPSPTPTPSGGGLGSNGSGGTGGIQEIHLPEKPTDSDYLNAAELINTGRGSTGDDALDEKIRAKAMEIRRKNTLTGGGDKSLTDRLGEIVNAGAASLGEMWDSRQKSAAESGTAGGALTAGLMDTVGNIWHSEEAQNVRDNITSPFKRLKAFIGDKRQAFKDKRDAKIESGEGFLLKAQDAAMMKAFEMMSEDSRQSVVKSTWDTANETLKDKIDNGSGDEKANAQADQILVSEIHTFMDGAAVDGTYSEKDIATVRRMISGIKDKKIKQEMLRYIVPMMQTNSPAYKQSMAQEKESKGGILGNFIKGTLKYSALIFKPVTKILGMGLKVLLGISGMILKISGKLFKSGVKDIAVGARGLAESLFGSKREGNESVGLIRRTLALPSKVGKAVGKVTGLSLNKMLSTLEEKVAGLFTKVTNWMSDLGKNALEKIADLKVALFKKDGLFSKAKGAVKNIASKIPGAKLGGDFLKGLTSARRDRKAKEMQAQKDALIKSAPKSKADAHLESMEEETKKSVGFLESINGLIEKINDTIASQAPEGSEARKAYEEKKKKEELEEYHRRKREAKEERKAEEAKRKKEQKAEAKQKEREERRKRAEDRAEARRQKKLDRETEAQRYRREQKEAKKAEKNRKKEAKRQAKADKQQNSKLNQILKRLNGGGGSGDGEGGGEGGGGLLSRLRGGGGGGKGFSGMFDIGKMIGSIGSLIKGPMKILASAVTALTGFKTLINTISKILSTSLTPLNRTFQKITRTIKPVLRTIRNAIRSVAKVVADISSSMIDILQPIVTDVLQPFFEQLGPVLTDLAKLFGKVFMPIMQTLMKTILGPLFVRFVTTLLPAVELIAAAVEFTAGVIETIAGGVLSILGFLTFNKDLQGTGSDMFTSGIGMIGQSIVDFKDATVGIFKAAVGKTELQSSTTNETAAVVKKESGTYVPQGSIFDGTYGSGDYKSIVGGANSQAAYGGYLGMGKHGCGPMALADMASRRSGTRVSATGLASSMARSGAYNQNVGTSVGGYIRTANAMGMGVRAGGVTNASLKRATPNNPVTLVGSGNGFGTRAGNTHYVNVIGSSSNGTSLVVNPMSGNVERRSTNDLLGHSILGLYGSGDTPIADEQGGGISYTFPDAIQDAMDYLKSLAKNLFSIFTGPDESDVIQQQIDESTNNRTIAQAKKILGDDYQKYEDEAREKAYADYAAKNPKKDAETDEEYKAKQEAYFQEHIMSYLATTKVFDDAQAQGGDAFANILNTSRNASAGLSNVISSTYNNMLGSSATAEKFITTAESDVGKGRGDVNCAGSHDWCANYISELMKRTGYTGAYDRTVGYLLQKLKDKPDEWKESTGSPQRGDILFFDWDNPTPQIDPYYSQGRRWDHVAIIKNVKDGTITYIDGNGGGSQYVKERTIPLSDDDVDTTMSYIKDRVSGSSSGSGTLPGSTDRDKVWNYLVAPTSIGGLGLSRTGAAGVLGNMKTESGFEPRREEGNYGTPIPNTRYCDSVDSGTISKDTYTGDEVGFGLVQWTTSDHKGPMYNIIKSDKNLSIGDMRGQLDFLNWELTSNSPMNFSDMMSTLRNDNTSVYDATYSFLSTFERPANMYENARIRSVDAQEIYDYYKDKPIPTSLTIESAESAYEKNLGSIGTGSGTVTITNSIQPVTFNNAADAEHYKNSYQMIKTGDRVTLKYDAARYTEGGSRVDLSRNAKLFKEAYKVTKIYQDAKTGFELLDLEGLTTKNKITRVPRRCLVYAGTVGSTTTTLTPSSASFSNITSDAKFNGYLSEAAAYASVSSDPHTQETYAYFSHLLDQGENVTGTAFFKDTYKNYYGKDYTTASPTIKNHGTTIPAATQSRYTDDWGTGSRSNSNIYNASANDAITGPIMNSAGVSRSNKNISYADLARLKGNGDFEIESFVGQGDDIPPVNTDLAFWNEMGFGDGNAATNVNNYNIVRTSDADADKRANTIMRNTFEVKSATIEAYLKEILETMKSQSKRSWAESYKGQPSQVANTKLFDEYIPSQVSKLSIG